MPSDSPIRPIDATGSSPQREEPASVLGAAGDGAVSPGSHGQDPLGGLLATNLAKVQRRIQAASTENGAQAPELVAVTKTVEPSVALALADLMPQPAQLGENRAEVLDKKRRAFEEAGGTRRARWHFIGHIQRNKARRIIERSDVLHSIDSLKLAKTVVRLTDELERSLEVFIEVNLTGETEKHGLDPEAAREVLEELASSERIAVAGLMAMGPARGLRSVDEVFGEVAQLAADLQTESPHAFHLDTCRLSMGMSGDLETAIRHGSHFVRVGSALFDGVKALRSTSPPAPPR